ncbi:MAG: stage III sporulation protein AB [Clostridiales bacterium]|nr:stage III sporulation protein AB [Clostridiales bacterium]
MTNKLFIIAICAAVGAATGFIIMKMYKRKHEYLVGVCDMIGELKRNISYRKDSAASVLSGFATDSAQLKKNIGEYIAYTEAKDGELDISRGFLTTGDHAKIKELFGALGTSDGASQMDRLDSFTTLFSELRDKAAEKSDKYGALSVKLGFLLGLGVGVLFL